MFVVPPWVPSSFANVSLRGRKGLAQSQSQPCADVRPKTSAPQRPFDSEDLASRRVVSMQVLRLALLLCLGAVRAHGLLLTTTPVATKEADPGAGLNARDADLARRQGKLDARRDTAATQPKAQQAASQANQMGQNRLRAWNSPECDVARREEAKRFAPQWQPLSAPPSLHSSHDNIFLLPSHRLAYVANQKAGSRSILALMRKLGPVHTVPVPYRSVNLSYWKEPAVWQSYTRFTFVREPMAAFLSGVKTVAHRHFRGGPTECTDGTTRAAYLDVKCGADVLSPFLADILARRCIGAQAYHVWPQTMKLDLPLSRPLDFVGQVEHFEEDMQALLRRINCTNCNVTSLLGHRNLASKMFDRCNNPIVFTEAVLTQARPIICQLLHSDYECLGAVCPLSHVGATQLSTPKYTTNVSTLPWWAPPRPSGGARATCGAREGSVQMTVLATIIAMDIRLPAERTLRGRVVRRLNHAMGGTDVFVQTDCEFEPAVQELCHIAAVKYANEGEMPPSLLELQPARVQWWRLQQAWALLEQHERAVGRRYEFVFKVRTDLAFTGNARLAYTYESRIRSSPSPPGGEAYLLADRLIGASRATMEHIAGLYADPFFSSLNGLCGGCGDLPIRLRAGHFSARIHELVLAEGEVLSLGCGAAANAKRKIKRAGLTALRVHLTQRFGMNRELEDYANLTKTQRADTNTTGRRAYKICLFRLIPARDRNRGFRTEISLALLLRHAGVRITSFQRLSPQAVVDGAGGTARFLTGWRKHTPRGSAASSACTRVPANAHPPLVLSAQELRKGIAEAKLAAGVFWLHFPKCGTSFKTVLQSAANALRTPDRMAKKLSFRYASRTDANHQSLTLEATCTQLAARANPQYTCLDEQRAAVAMFREPKQRLMSSYWWIHSKNTAHNLSTRKRCCSVDWGWTPQVYKPMWAQIARLRPPSATIARFPGCYTRMILGYGCLDANAPPGGLSVVNVAAAIERLSRFRFVGETTEWHLSVCLFNKIVLGRAYVGRHQLVNTRPTSVGESSDGPPPVASDSQHHKERYNTSGLPDDWADQQVYSYARLRFREDLARHNISSEQDCPVTEE